MQRFRADCAIECDQEPVLTGSSRERVGGLVPGDDVKNNDLIFVGSPSENLTPLEIPGAQEFVFKRVPSGPRKGDLSIVNAHPQPDEEKALLATPSKQPLSDDNAVVVLVRWIQSGAISDDPGGHDNFRHARRGGIRLPPERGCRSVKFASRSRRPESRNFRGRLAREGGARRAGK